MSFNKEFYNNYCSCSTVTSPKKIDQKRNILQIYKVSSYKWSDFRAIKCKQT